MACRRRGASLPPQQLALAGSPACRPAGRARRTAPARAARRGRRGVSASYWAARSRTGARARPRGAAVAARAALEEHALAQPRVGRLDASKPPTSITFPPRARRPGRGRPGGLDPRHRAALGGGSSASRSTSSPSAARATREALDAEGGQLGRELRGRGEVAHGAADPDEPPAAAQPVAPRRARSATCARSALICLPLARSPGRKRSVIRTAPSGQERVGGEPARRRA